MQFDLAKLMKEALDKNKNIFNKKAFVNPILLLSSTLTGCAGGRHKGTRHEHFLWWYNNGNLESLLDADIKDYRYEIENYDVSQFYPNAIQKYAVKESDTLASLHVRKCTWDLSGLEEGKSYFYDGHIMNLDNADLDYVIEELKLYEKEDPTSLFYTHDSYLSEINNIPQTLTLYFAFYMQNGMATFGNFPFLNGNGKLYDMDMDQLNSSYSGSEI